jgi:hypothetical protein
MTDIAVPPYYMMVVNELLKPFFIFQVGPSIAGTSVCGCIRTHNAPARDN